MTIREKRVIIEGKVSLGATVSYADKGGRAPAVVLVMGTGRTDRDGNEKGFRTNLYKDLAEFFAGIGCVCIRYDKRGTYQSSGDFQTAGLYDLADDAISVIRYAKSLPCVEADKVIVCGHSEGAMIATLLSGCEATAGLILLGGAATCMKDALLYQNELAAEEFQKKKGLLGALLRSQASPEKTNAKVESMFGKCVNAKKDKVFFGGTMLNAKWVREHASLTSEDYAGMLRSYGKPILAVTGTADLSADYRKLALLRNTKTAEAFAPTNVNHILREIDDDNSMLTVKKQYIRLAKRPIHEETARTLKEWMETVRTAG